LVLIERQLVEIAAARELFERRRKPDVFLHDLAGRLHAAVRGLVVVFLLGDAPAVHAPGSGFLRHHEREAIVPHAAHERALAVARTAGDAESRGIDAHIDLLEGVDDAAHAPGPRHARARPGHLRAVEIEEEPLVA